MRLLIVTQKVDRTDPILGFFHRWIEEFARYYEQVIVIGQMVGEHQLPRNVIVLSLGKEKGSWRFVQVLRYRWILFWRRKQYDAIFVHMTPIWAVCAWRMVVFFRKPLYLWYEAKGDRWPLKFSLRLAKKTFSASPSGMPVRTPKSVVTGHGIDTVVYAAGSDPPDPEQLLTVGRITAAKRLHLILRAISRLPSSVHLLIIGATITAEDMVVLMQLRQNMAEWGIKNKVEWKSLPPYEVPAVLRRSAVFLHASTTGLDKALLEAMASGCLVVSCSDAARGLLPEECLSSPEDMAVRVKTLMKLSAKKQAALRKQLRDIVVQKHSLERLIQRLVQEMR